MEIGNIYSEVSQKSQGEIFENLVSNGKVKIERIVSRGHSSPENFWYDQKQNEWVIVLKGEAVLRFAGGNETVRMKAGDYVAIPAHCPHRVEWTDPERETVWLAVHF